MKILLTCDDGIYSDGVKALRESLKTLGTLYVIAPLDQKSAVSHGITLYTPLVTKKIRANGIRLNLGVNGTPADCVKLAITKLLPGIPDIVVSGMNKGLNVGSNVLYSGTVAAAFESSMFQITSYAVSLEDSKRSNLKNAGRIARRIISRISRKVSTNTNVVFNINIPASATKHYKGYVWSKQESMRNPDNYQKRVDPRGRTYFWLHEDKKAEVYKRIEKSGIMDFPTDAYSVHHGLVSVTPLKRDFTNYELLREFSASINTKR